ncbi:MAG TPA: hypothetical protein VF865_12100 [Acidobacteriaceae bacterium]
MRTSSMFLVLLLSSATAGAQTSTSSNPTVLVLPPIASSCPVRLSVDRRPDGRVVQTKSAPAHHGQGLNLGFWKSTELAKSEAQIASADITVHFYPAAAHAIPAAPATHNTAPPTETFHLTGHSGEPLLSSSIWTREMAIVSWVELTRLNYADGTSWQSSAPRQCGAAPNLYVLIEAAR